MFGTVTFASELQGQRPNANIPEPTRKVYMGYSPTALKAQSDLRAREQRSKLSEGEVMNFDFEDQTGSRR